MIEGKAKPLDPRELLEGWCEKNEHIVGAAGLSLLT